MRKILRSAFAIIDALICKLKRFDEKLLSSNFYRFLTLFPRKLLRNVRWIRNHSISCVLRTVLLKIRLIVKCDSPLVSVVLPVYNVELYLEQCLDSLLNQTLRAIEIITVDDGSTDHSLEILNKYAQRDKRVHVFTQQNKYAGAARNLGLSHAIGEYVLFLDSDDYFSKNLVKDAYIAAKAANADIVLFDARAFDNVTGCVKNDTGFLFNYLAPRKQPFSYKDCPDNFFQLTTPCPWTKLFRRQFVLNTELQFQHIQNANDLYFVLSALPMAERIVTLDKVLVYYRTGLSNNVQSTKKKHPLCFYEAYLAWHDQLAALGVLDELRQSYSNMALNGCLFNLHTSSSQDAQKEVLNILKHEAFEALELSCHSDKYYQDKKNYKEMHQILKTQYDYDY